MTTNADLATDYVPNTEYDARELFGLDITLKVPGFRETSAYVPAVDDTLSLIHI